jgi:O-antigen/teichoic acid export membrane protein
MSSLGSKAKSSVLWNTGFNLFRDVLHFLVMLALVRVLAPKTYGEFALVTSIIGFIHVFSFNTFVQHVLQERDDSKVDYQNHFTFGFYLQLSMFFVTNLLAYAMQWLHIYETVAVYMHILSIVFFLELFSELRRMELQRDLDWKRLRILHGIGLLVGSILAIMIAYSGGGIYALIIPSFLSNIPFIYEMLVVQKWRPTWKFNKKHYKETIKFSKERIVSGLMKNGRPLIENSIFISMLSFSHLGIYSKAAGLATLLANKFAMQITLAIYPILTRVTPGTDSFRRISGLIVAFIVWTVIPVVFFVDIVSSELILVLYGSNWIEVIPLIGLATIIVALNAICHILYSLLLSSHKERICTLYDFFILISMTIIILLFLPYSMKIYMYAQVTLMFLITIFMIYISLHFKVIDLKSLYPAFAPSIISSFMAWAFIQLLFVNKFTEVESVALKLTLYAVLYAVLYLSCLRVLFSKHLLSLILYLPGKKAMKKYFLLDEGN